MRIIQPGTGSVITQWVMRDDTDHLPKSDVTITDIDIYYQKDGEAQSAKVDLQALDSADAEFSAGHGYHCGNSVYRIDFSNDAFTGEHGSEVILIVVCAGCDTLYQRYLLLDKTEYSLTDDYPRKDDFAREGGGLIGGGVL